MYWHGHLQFNFDLPGGVPIMEEFLFHMNWHPFPFFFFLKKKEKEKWENGIWIKIDIIFFIEVTDFNKKNYYFQNKNNIFIVKK